MHNLALEGDVLWLGTHQGLYRQVPGQEPERVSEHPFDVMGLARGEQNWLASGHPGSGQGGPADLGLQVSRDGVRWEALSLEGEVDFHRLTALGSLVAGIAAADGALHFSSDGGRTWERHDSSIFDLALGGTEDQPILLGTTPEGLLLSSNRGVSFSNVPAAPPLMLVTWGGDRFVGVSPDGRVFSAPSGDARWTEHGSIGGQPIAMAADRDYVAVHAGTAILESTDGGRSFSERITGIALHAGH